MLLLLHLVPSHRLCVSPALRSEYFLHTDMKELNILSGLWLVPKKVQTCDKHKSLTQTYVRIHLQFHLFTGGTCQSSIVQLVS